MLKTNLFSFFQKGFKSRWKKNVDVDSLDVYKMDKEHLPRSAYFIRGILLALLAIFIWAYIFHLDEVSTGQGKVIPSSREQIIQSLEGGILKKLNVKEGQLVEKDEVLAILDSERTMALVEESQARVDAALATSVRLRAEVDGTELVFPEELKQTPKQLAIISAETALYQSKRDNLEKTIAGLKEAIKLVKQELDMTTRLKSSGAASDVEVLRLKRQLNELELKVTETQTEYLVRAREELAKADAEVSTQRSVTLGRMDALKRTTILSPVQGIVKDIQVSTDGGGGVVPPNGRLMAIVPTNDDLLIEAKISPRDIAYIHPDQVAIVKISAYDYAIYGGLKGKVETISPDTIQDEVRREIYYYRVFIRTDKSFLENKDGKQFYITPGMVATVDIQTGSKTVWDYLTKPLNRAREALRER